jgi:hypothetical protein
MRPSSTVLALVVLGTASSAQANQPWHAFEEFELVEPWSWGVLVSASAALELPDERGVVGQYGAQARIRYGTARDANEFHGRDDPNLVAFGAGVQTAAFDTLEPYLFVGAHRLSRHCECGGTPIWFDRRIDLAAGYAWSRGADAAGAPFAKLLVGLGGLSARRVGHVVPFARGPVTSSRHRFQTQLDVVMSVQVDLDGDVRIALGIEVDPVRLFQDLVR